MKFEKIVNKIQEHLEGIDAYRYYKVNCILIDNDDYNTYALAKNKY